MYGQVGSNKKGWLLPALQYPEVVVPVICILPHLDYCSVVWNNCGATLTGHVDMQNTKLCTQSDSTQATSHKYWTASADSTLKARWHNAMLCQIHRCCTNQAPPYLCSNFAPNSNLNCTVEPPNKGRFGNGSFVLYLEVVPISEVQLYNPQIMF